MIGSKADIYSIKADRNGSYFVSVGSDKVTRISDIRMGKCAKTIHSEEIFTEMNDICLNHGTT